MADIVRLTDPEHLTVVSIAPSFGNIAYSMTVRGVEILYKPAPDLDAWRAKPGLGGVPLLSPWANRIDADAFYANGKKYACLTPGSGMSGATAGIICRSMGWCRSQTSGGCFAATMRR